MMSNSRDISLFSFSHRNTPLEVRDRLVFSREETDAFVPIARGSVASEVAVLSTCNRTEFYLFGAPENLDWTSFAPVVGQAKEIVQGVSPTVFRGRETARHLFRVAASIESLALGEDQILAQVKEVHRQVLESSGKSPVLDRLCQFAIRAGKRVRTETALCDGAVSISSAAVTLAKRIFGDFRPLEIALIGAGETNESAAENFRAAGASRFVVVNRSPERGQALAEKFAGRYAPLEDLEKVLKTADVAVFATGSPTHLATRDMMKRVMKARSFQSIFMIDISNPRNVAPEVGDVSGVFLFNIDDLEQVVRDNLRERQAEIPKAEAIIEEVLDEWVAWMQSMQVLPTIGDLAKFFEAIRQQEIEKHRGKLSDEELATMEAFSKGMVKKLLHNPITFLRNAADQGLRPDDLHTVRNLFKLDDDQ